MILIAIIIGCVIGAIIGIFMPIIPYTYSGYLAIAIIAALDSVFGGIVATLNKNFDLKTIFKTNWRVNFGNRRYNCRYGHWNLKSKHSYWGG